MNHGVAIRADRPKILNRVEAIPLADCRNWNYVMNVNVAHRNASVCGFEIESTYHARLPIMRDAFLPTAAVSLIFVDQNLILYAFENFQFR